MILPPCLRISFSKISVFSDGGTTSSASPITWIKGIPASAIILALLIGETSMASPGAVSCAASTGAYDVDPGTENTGCLTPMGGVDGGAALMNFPVAIQTSITYGLRYEINDSAALKIEHSVVDVEDDPSKIDHQFGINFGLFDTSFTGAAPTEKVGVTSIALDVVF